MLFVRCPPFFRTCSTHEAIVVQSLVIARQTNVTVFRLTSTNGEAQLEFDLRKIPAANNLSFWICTFALITRLRRHGRCLMGRVPGCNSIRKGGAVQWPKSVLSRENRCSYVDNTSANLSRSGIPQSWWRIPSRMSCRWGGVLPHSRRNQSLKYKIDELTRMA